MDHLAVLREKIEILRVEIAQLRELNERDWHRDRNDIQPQIAYSKKQDRLEEIQQELTQLASLGQQVRSVKELKEQHCSRSYFVKK